jgi:hypothetical protein
VATASSSVASSFQGIADCFAPPPPVERTLLPALVRSVATSDVQRVPFPTPERPSRRHIPTRVRVLVFGRVCLGPQPIVLPPYASSRQKLGLGRVPTKPNYRAYCGGQRASEVFCRGALAIPRKRRWRTLVMR